MSEWTEVNVLPASAEEWETLLTGVAEPLVRDLYPSWDRWHFFWEPELRLRFRWREGDGACREQVAAYLDQARDAGKLTSWTEAPYDGEADSYGRDVWEAMASDWMSGSELALAIIRAGAKKPESRGWYWARREHLFANQLSVPETWLLLREAEARLTAWNATHPVIRDILAAAGRYLDDEGTLKAEDGLHRRALALALRPLDAEMPPSSKVARPFRKRGRTARA